MKKLIILCLLTATPTMSQERLLVTPNNEVIPLKQGESAIEAAKRSGVIQSIQTTDCPTQQFLGYPPNIYPPDSVFGHVHYRDVIGMWFIAPAAGTIDTIFWQMGSSNGAKDSILIVRIHESNIYPGHGPGDSIYPPPCVPWGFYRNSFDPDQGIAAFIEEATDTTWYSTIPGTTPSFPPAGREPWGFIGVQVVAHTNSVNHLAIMDIGIPLSVKADQPFFISMRINGTPNGIDLPPPTTFVVNTAQAPIPARNWVFYEHDGNDESGLTEIICGGVSPAPYGWFARGGPTGQNDAYVLNWWYTMTASTNTPPTIVPLDILKDTILTEPRTVNAEIIDCNAASPESAGIASALLVYNALSIGGDTIPMINILGSVWSETIPGFSAPVTVQYKIIASDSNGSSTSTPLYTYNLKPMISVDAIDGWNLFSDPLIPADPRASNIFPFAIANVYTYQDGYQSCDTIENGVGYWVKFPVAQAFGFVGDTIQPLSIPVVQGWNLIGSINMPVPVNNITLLPDDSILQSTFVGYDGGYTIADSLHPGRGYWVKMNANGQLILQSTTSAGKAFPSLHDVQKMNQLIIHDAGGHQQTLYTCTEPTLSSSPERFEFPPPPPVGAFDVRFASNQMVSIYPARLEQNKAYRYPIIIRYVTYPLTIHFIMKGSGEDKLFTLIEESEGGPIESHELLDGERITTRNEAVRMLVLSISDRKNIPTTFALYQNYPNPFNPTTTIAYDLAKISIVTLQVYNLLGQVVKTLVNKLQEAGRYSVVLDSEELSTGIYFYRLTAENFTATKKMLLMQ